jgi:hydrogenase nickel incorporation protein HypA/HybF
MHELSVVRELLRVAAEKTPPGHRLLEVRVTVGRLTCISPEAMRFYFEALREDLVGRRAALAVTLAPLVGVCARCGERTTREERSWLCPRCGDPTLRFENGDELTLDSLVVDDGGPDHDRAEDPPEERRPGRREPP